jgi:hypothetical protein
LVRACSVIVELHIILIRVILPEFERQAATSGGDSVTEPHRDPVQVEEPLEIKDVGVVRDKQKKLSVSGLK